MIKCLFHLLATTAVCCFANIVQAQTYTPSDRTPQADGSIGTIVDPVGANFNITGGLRRGQNLFHSFTDFSIPTNGAANFTNPQGNQSIITRVTGNLFSDINGTLNTNGANFLLINPNGVVFGPGVSLNVGKAFVTSTASGVDLVDAQGGNYNFGVNQQGDPLLSIAPDVAFNPARLTMNASIPGRKGIENYGTLQTNNPGQYIGLIGGNINFYGGQLIAPGAKVELGGLVKSGTVGFSLDNGVQLPANVERGNVSLVKSGTSPSLIDVRAGGGGSVRIFVKDISLQGTGTAIRAGIAAGLGSPTAKAGDIKLDATGDIMLSGAVDIFNRVNTGGVGKGGNIEINTRNLSLTNSAQIQASTLGKGDAGSVKITADNVSFDGAQDGFYSAVVSRVERGAVGKGGNVEINTRNLSLTNSARLTASTLGQGDSGNLNITATGNVSFDNSYAFSRVEQGAVGKGGDIEINTRNLSVTNGAVLTASTFGQGDAGNVKITATGDVSFDGRKDGFNSGTRSTVEQGGVGKGGNVEINTRNLSVTNGAQLQASTKGQGDAGSIKITATGNVSFDGVQDGFSSAAFSRVAPTGVGKGGNIEINTQNLSVTNGTALVTSTSGQGDAGNIKITATGNVSFDGIQDGFNSAASSAVDKGGQGKGGNIEIDARNLSVTNDAGLIASTLGQGNAGNIFLNANTIKLDQGQISSTSNSSTGGDVNITTKDYLLLRNASFIATDSASSDKDGNGGNITINSPLIIALPGNNDITANANQGNGGRVNITSQGLFGIQYRPIGTAFSNDITASSTFGQSGSVQINTPGIDPGKDTGELPAAPNDPSNQISQACSASQRENKFYITGRGGLPPNASEPQESEALWQDAREVKTKPATTASQSPTIAPPAVGWVFQPDGRVRLIAAQTGAGSTGNKVVCPNK
jgi:filamentous hemagglutinin family protein